MVEALDLDREVVTSGEIAEGMRKSEDWVPVPNGHNMIVSNQKSKLYKKMFKKGQPCMDYLAEVLVRFEEER